jgi:hypothetical protein
VNRFYFLKKRMPVRHLGMQRCAARGDRDRSREGVVRAQANVKAKAEVTEETVVQFGQLVHEGMAAAGDTPTRRVWLTSIIDRSEIDDGKIRLSGRKDVLEQCAIAAAGGKPGVRTLVPKWRSLREYLACNFASTTVSCCLLFTTFLCFSCLS